MHLLRFHLFQYRRDLLHYNLYLVIYLLSLFILQKTVDKLPDKVLLEVFGYLRHKDLCRISCVCRKWRLIAYDSKLWTRVSLRPEYSDLHVSNFEALLGLISVRFSNTLR